jgi:hypothetical protein
MHLKGDKGSDKMSGKVSDKNADKLSNYDLSRAVRIYWGIFE